MGTRVIAIFGAQGDLAQRKLFPALYQLLRTGFLKQNIRILALGRHINEDFANQTVEHMSQYVSSEYLNEANVSAFKQILEYCKVDFGDVNSYSGLVDKLSSDCDELILYYATPSRLYGVISECLHDVNCIQENTRVVLEKPIGTDLESSQEINQHLMRYFNESQIFRIDHYLGKETVQNLIALRFANSLFETQWNHTQISHVEITVAEQVGIEGRWGYFDQVGQLRDMVQNHLLQLLCMVAMDPPCDLSADSIRNEKVKVLKALKPISKEMVSTHVVRGRYTAGISNGKPVPGYLEEEGANTDSHAETFVAIKAEINNWRWAGVPFYLRTGKRMPEKLSQIIVHFKPAPHYIFDPDQQHLANNILTIRIQPDEGISLRVLSKSQGLGTGMRLSPGPLDLTFSETFQTERVPDAYERLLLEIFEGNQYLFVRHDEIEYAWKWCDQLSNCWKDNAIPPKNYAAGTWGPAASIALISRDGRNWSEDA